MTENTNGHKNGHKNGNKDGEQGEVKYENEPESYKRHIVYITAFFEKHEEVRQWFDRNHYTFQAKISNIQFTTT